jgi:hypothetical protein
MHIVGAGFTYGAQDLKVTGYTVKTVLAIQWTQTACGNWYATDRGVENDYYEATVVMAGRYSVLENLVYQINKNRTNGSNVVTLSYFSDNERIFGADLVYNSITATVLDFPEMVQRSLYMWQIKIRFRALKPLTFQGDATMPVLALVKTGYDGNVDLPTINKYDTYKGSYSYLESNTDSGVFKGTFTLTQSAMADLRRYWATYRGAEQTITNIPGVYKPFGKLRPTWPITCKIKSIDDEQMRDLRYWTCNVQLVEYVAPNA